MYYSKDFNILAINLDGLRRDKLFHCPALKSLSERSYYFSKMDTVTPYTFTSLHAIFSGLSNSNGFMVTILSDNGSITSSIQLAIGYTIKGIHSDNGLLALAAGHDGILLFNWNINDTIFIGKIRTSYANNVKLSDNVIYVATEDGIEIIQIDY